MKARKFISLGLALLGIVSLASCGKDKEDPKGETEEEKAARELQEYYEKSEEIYQEVLGDFDGIYAEALKAESLSERFALMAKAEAKMLEQGVMIPLTANGGNYAISRVVPRTVPTVQWGTDTDRFKNAVIVKERPLLPAERTELTGLWNQSATEADWRSAVATYLAGKNLTTVKQYNMAYSSEPTTYDILAAYRSVDAEFAVNTYDGLVEYNSKNELVPALAKALPTVSEDGLVYTFEIKEGVKWVNKSGSVIADVTAQDWVTGMQHLLDAQAGLEELMFGLIENAQEYAEGKCAWEDVGVKVVDGKLQYTLEEKTPYFLTMLSYNPFAPMNKAFFESKGGKLGVKEYAAAVKAEGYTYGISEDNILYCGAYLVSAHSKNSEIKFDKNNEYWAYKDADDSNNPTIQTIHWQFNNGEVATWGIDKLIAGGASEEKTIWAGAGLNATSVQASKTKVADTDTTCAETADGSWFKKYAYVTSTDASSYPAFININRTNFVSMDNTAGSSKSEAQKLATVGALKNQNFRLALCLSLDRVAYNEQSVGKDLGEKSLVNSYVPGDFVVLDEAVTMKYEDAEGQEQSKVFPAGTKYGEVLQFWITQDGYPMKVWDATKGDGAGSSGGFDGWHNKEKAIEYWNKAVEELGLGIAYEIAADCKFADKDYEEGDVVVMKKADFDALEAAEKAKFTADGHLSGDGAYVLATKIVIDLPTFLGSDTYYNRARSLEKSIEKVLPSIDVQLTGCQTSKSWYYAGYYCDYGYERNYDIYDVSGWGPDYGDPSTYLNTMIAYGSMVNSLGIF